MKVHKLHLDHLRLKGVGVVALQAWIILQNKILVLIYEGLGVWGLQCVHKFKAKTVLKAQRFMRIWILKVVVMDSNVGACK